MMLLDAGLRGGAVALLALLAIVSWRDGRSFAAERASGVFDLCAICYLLETAPALRDSPASWLLLLRVASNATPGVFPVWALARFADGFAPRWRYWLPFVAMLALASAAVLSDLPAIWAVVHGAQFVLTAAGIALALTGRGADLVESRRRARVAFALALGLLIVATTALGLFRPAGLAESAAVLAIALIAALLRLGVRAEPATEAGAPAVPLTAVWPLPEEDRADRALADRLGAMMETDRVYREGGLTVASLAAKLRVPEHRLRRLINQRLGQRNFVAFVNGYRLAEAKAALADPAQARVPVLTIALDAGFQSIGPFNRAFKADTGVTPTEYRRSWLADSGIG